VMRAARTSHASQLMTGMLQDGPNRAAIVDILRETTRSLLQYFQPSSRR